MFAAVAPANISMMCDAGVISVNRFASISYIELPEPTLMSGSFVIADVKSKLHLLTLIVQLAFPSELIKPFQLTGSSVMPDISIVPDVNVCKFAFKSFRVHVPP